MPRYIIGPQDSERRKTKAEAICRRINDALGYRAADPQWEEPSLNRAGAYTGGIVISERAADEIAAAIAFDSATGQGRR